MSVVALRSAAIASLMIAVVGGVVFAADKANKDEAIAMVKKAVDFIKQQGPEKGYAEITNKTGQFVDRDLYIVVYGLDGKVHAHGANEKLIGTDQSEAKDPDGKTFVKERIAMGMAQPSFWQDYKFMNPVTKNIEPKETYCERLEQTVVCGGIYKS